MSNFCEVIQFGPDNWYSFIRYALTISWYSDMKRMSTRLPSTVTRSPVQGTKQTGTVPGSREILIDATSNTGDCGVVEGWQCRPKELKAKRTAPVSVVFMVLLSRFRRIQL